VWKILRHPPKRDKDGHLIPKATPESELDDEENLGIPLDIPIWASIES